MVIAIFFSILSTLCSATADVAATADSSRDDCKCYVFENLNVICGISSNSKHLFLQEIMQSVIDTIILKFKDDIVAFRVDKCQ